VKSFNTIAWSASRCRREVEELQRLLGSSRSLPERQTLLPFFRARPHLVALCGWYSSALLKYDLVAFEYDLFGDFACDLVVGDSKRCAFGFIEIEAGSPNALFVKRRPRSSPAWSPRFEQGFSQLVDWFCKLDDMEKTDEYAHRFGKRSIAYFGLMLIGRSESLGPREQRRLQWRQEKVLVNSQKIHCLTYDQLCQDLLSRLEVIESGAMS